jgi:hypothetical protein
MSLPDVNVEVKDGALGLVSSFPAGVFGMVGPAAAGTVNAPVIVTDPDAVDGVFGSSALATALKDALASGARTIVAARTAAPVAGSISEVTKTSTTSIRSLGLAGSGTGTVVLSGTPTAIDLLDIEIVDPGAVGVATFRWRVGTGAWSEAILTAATVALAGTGCTAAFADGAEPTSFVAADLWRFELYGAGTGSVTASGTPTGDHDVDVLITFPGGLNEAKFRYQLDDGALSSEQTVQASFVLPGTGATLAFVAGVSGTSFGIGDRYSLSTTGPVTTVQAYAAAIEALNATPYGLEWIHVVGPTDSAAWTAFDALLETAADHFKFRFVVCEARGLNEGETVDEWVAALVLEIADFSGKRVCVVAGDLVIDGEERNGAGRFSGRLAGLSKISVSAGRVIDGPLAGVTNLAPLDDDENPMVNEGHALLLDAAHYTTFRKFESLSGVYVTNARMAVDDTSDFRWVEYRRVMDKACREVRLAGLKSEHREADQAGLEALKTDCEKPLRTMVAAGEISAGSVLIPDGQDFLATSRVAVKVRIQPKATMRFIDLELGFENPFGA